MNSNVTTKDNYSLYIYDEDDFETIKNKLYSDSIIINKKTFEWLAKKLDYPQYLKSGHYVIKDGMNNNQLLHNVFLVEKGKNQIFIGSDVLIAQLVHIIIQFQKVVLHV